MGESMNADALAAMQIPIHFDWLVPGLRGKPTNTTTSV